MKTQNFGIASLPLPMGQQFLCMLARLLQGKDVRPLMEYVRKRNNLSSVKNDPPFDGQYTWIKYSVYGDFVSGRSDAVGLYEYALRYDEGPKDREWMEENDQIYLRQLVTSNELKEKEPEVWYLREIDIAQRMDIGEWWVKKLAEYRDRGIDIAKVLQNAKQEYQLFLTRESEEQQHRQKEEQDRKRQEEIEKERLTQEEADKKAKKEAEQQRLLKEKQEEERIRQEQEKKEREAMEQARRIELKQ